MKWTEANIGRALARQTFKGNLCVLPNCTWTGHEIDLLVVTPDLRVVDVEIKISRADLKADAAKDKWWFSPPYIRGVGGTWERPAKTPRAWPPRVWKHYYAMPAEIWRDDLLASISPISGVLLLSASRMATVSVECRRRARPCRTADAISATDVINIARLASLRMWDAYAEVEKIDAGKHQ